MRQLIRFLLVPLSLIWLMPLTPSLPPLSDQPAHAGPARRIACLYAFSSHTVIMLGKGDQMVAVVKGVKKDRLVRQMIPGIRDIPTPFAGGVIHIEALLKTRPDIVFLKPETAKIQGEIRKLERFKLPYLVAGYHSMAEQMQTIQAMGRAIGCQDKAAAYTRYYRDRVALVRSRTREIPAGKRVRLFHSINEPLRTDAPGTIEADWTTACGVVNVSLDARLAGRDNKRFAGMEQILIWNPDTIIVNEEGVDQAILSDEKWESVEAVRENRVFQIPVGISRWGHPGGLEPPLAVLWTAKTVYPGLFADIDLKQEVRDFYHRFFDFSLDDDMIQQILSGKGMRTRKK